MYNPKNREHSNLLILTRQTTLAAKFNRKRRVNKEISIWVPYTFKIYLMTDIGDRTQPDGQREFT